MQGLDGEATEDVVRELQESQAEAQDPEVQFAAAAALCEPLRQDMAATDKGQQLLAAHTRETDETSATGTPAMSSPAENSAKADQQAAETPREGDMAQGAASDSGAPDRSFARSSGLAVLIRVLSSPRATANPTHVYMLLRLLDAASKLKV